MDFRQFFYDGLLQDTKWNADGLQIFRTRGDMDIYRFKSGVINDIVLD